MAASFNLPPQPPLAPQSGGPGPGSGQIPPTGLNVRAFTWNRDSHGLFDYESQSVTKRTFKVKNEAKIFRAGNEVKMTEGKFEPQQVAGQHLISVNSLSRDLNLTTEPEEYAVSGKQYTQNGEVRNDDIWLVVRSLKNADGKVNYMLHKNDIIKLGRVKFRIKDLFIPGIDGTAREMEEPFDEVIVSKDIEMKQGYHCRFCWTDEQSADNPMISACKCTGTMGLVHLDCLRAWQTTKMQTKRNENLISLYWKTFECQICKTAYPFKVKHQEKIFRLVEVDVPPSQCRLVLESLIFDKNSSRMIHVILPSTSKRTYKMVRREQQQGRGHDSDVRISDISVSRLHAVIRYEGDHFVLEDNASKFGTLVLVKDQLHLENGSSKAVQIGRTVVSFSLKNAQQMQPAGMQRGSSHLFMQSPENRNRQEDCQTDSGMNRSGLEGRNSFPGQQYDQQNQNLLGMLQQYPGDSYDAATQSQILQLCTQILMQQQHLQANLRNLQQMSGMSQSSSQPQMRLQQNLAQLGFSQNLPSILQNQPQNIQSQLQSTQLSNNAQGQLPNLAIQEEMNPNQQLLQLIQQNSALQILSQMNSLHPPAAYPPQNQQQYGPGGLNFQRNFSEQTSAPQHQMEDPLGVNYYEEFFGQEIGAGQLRSSIQEGMIDMITNLQGAQQQVNPQQRNLPQNFQPGHNPVQPGAPHASNYLGPNNPGDVEEIGSDSEDNESNENYIEVIPEGEDMMIHFAEDDESNKN